MRYASGSAFRRALEERLRQQALQTGTPLIRLRKMVAFERFLARLMVIAPDRWVLKGGLALQLRLGDRARTTQDIDLLWRQNLPPDEVHQLLVQAALSDMGDWFSFEISSPAPSNPWRFAVRSLLDGRLFERFHVDVGTDDPLEEPTEMLVAPTLLEFAGIAPTVVPAYPIAQQIAEKVHAWTRPYTSGQSSRIKDCVDILLLAQQSRLQASHLLRALRSTFLSRATHPLPENLPDIPEQWQTELRRMAEQTGLGWRNIREVSEALRRFLEPVMHHETEGQWDPVRWQWNAGAGHHEGD